MAHAASVPYSPAQIRHAYGFDKLPYDGAGETIAIVDAYDDPNIRADLHTFDNAFDLADPSFTKATPQGKPAAAKSDWAGEMALDVEWRTPSLRKQRFYSWKHCRLPTRTCATAVDYARVNRAWLPCR